MRDRLKTIHREVRGMMGSALGWPSPSEHDRYTHVIAEIRRLDFSTHSDRQLREALERIKCDVVDTGPEGRLPEVFAVVNEAVSRRLGAWRLFDPAFDASRMALYRQMAERILTDPDYQARRDGHAEENFPDAGAFDQIVEPLLAKMGIDDADRPIVKTIVYVIEKGALTYQPEIMLPAEFYMALEARDREGVLRFRTTDQQLLGGLYLYEGKVVEMHSGEGKTVAAAFPAVLHALSGRAVHVMTANDYLALRDAEWLAPVYESLGFTVFALLDHMIDDERRTAYGGDIVYGTVREFGFDFLRDNLNYTVEERVQGRRDVAIVDEADHAMIDDARTPLIISGKGSGGLSGLNRIKDAVRDLVALQSAEVRGLEAGVLGADENGGSLRHVLATLLLAAPDSDVLGERLSRRPGLIRRLRSVINGEELEDSRRALTKRLYYEFDQSLEAVSLTYRGQRYLEGRLGSLFDARGQDPLSDTSPPEEDGALSGGARRRERERIARSRHRRHRGMNHVFQMLRAYVLMARDVDYAVADEAVVPIDEATGRLRPDTRYQHGLHAALEAKEGVPVQPEGEVLAEITVRGYLRQYLSLSGMTGTAMAARDEFRGTYGLDVVAVPASRRSRRADLAPRVYGSRQEKLGAVVDEIMLCRRVGRPVLVAARTVEQSQELSVLLNGHGIGHRLLNAVTTFDEPRVVRDAGMSGSVTIATNMAGRGTDIVLQLGLDDLVTDGYCRLVRELLADGRAVVLECPAEVNAEGLRAALENAGLPPGARVTLSGDGCEVMVTPAKMTSSGAEPARLKFGLGLHVIGTEINESVRIDLQLRGRSGRQGGSGSSEFLLSIEDEMLRLSGTRAGPRSRADVDASGRSYVGGEAAVRHLRRVQGMAETDVEVQRGAQNQFVQVLESHTLAYFDLRSQVMDAESIHGECIGFARDRAMRLVDEYLPVGSLEDYHTRFDRLAEDVWLDYQVDCGPLCGASLEALSNGIGVLLTDRLERARSVAGRDAYARLQKLVYLQAADDQWKSYLSRAEDIMSSARLCGYGLKAALADYTFQADKEFALFRRDVADTFLLSLLEFPVEAGAQDDGFEDSEARELAEILA